MSDNPFASFLTGTAPEQVQRPASNPFATFVESPQPTEGAPAPGEARSYDLAEVPGAMARNFTGNAKEKLSGLHEAIFGHPLETLKGIDRMANAILFPTKDWMSENSVLKGVTDDAIKRYGSWDDAKRTAAEDPLGFVMDVLGLVPGPTAGAGRTANAVKTTAAALDPARALVSAPIKAVEAASKGTAKLAQAISQSEHGTAAGALSELFKSGERVTPGVWETLTKGLDADKVRGQLGDIISEMFRERSDSYLSGMKSVAGHDNVIDFAKIDKAMGDAAGIGVYKAPKDTGKGPGYNFEKDKSVKAARAAILAEIEKFRQMGPSYHTAEGFDKLKQAINQIGDNVRLDSGMPSRGSAFANKIADSIVATVASEAPEYGAVMKKYHTDSREIENLMREFSTGKRTSNPLTTLRKLQSIWRNHANNGYTARGDFLKDVAQRTGNGDLIEQLAAHEYNPLAPRGLRGVGHGLHIPMAAGHALMSPATGVPHLAAAVAGSTVASPRLMGMAAYGLGRAAPYARPVGRAIRGLEQATPWMFREQRWDGMEPQEEERRAGGFFRGRG